jgi:hypothetical protein
MTSRYVVVKFGYLTRGETMNVAVLAWEYGRGPKALVHQIVLHNWDRIHTAFPRVGTKELQDDVLARLAAIRTVGDYEEAVRRSGPYTPLEFTDENGSTATAESTLASMATFFLGPLSTSMR